MHLAKAEKVPMPEASHEEGPYAPLSHEQFERFFMATLWRFYELRRVESEDDMKSLIQKVDLLTLDPCRPEWASLAMAIAATLAHYKSQLA